MSVDAHEGGADGRSRPARGFARPARRLLTALVILAVLDPLVPPLLERLERQRYDGDSLFRFNISDLFSLGPVVAYLREHPRGPRPRVMFLGSSVVWGWEVRAPETMPAQFQRLNPGLRVLNFGLNASETPTSYLIARDVVDAVDLFVAIDFGDGANPRLSTMIPVEPRDIERFNLRRPDRVEAMLERARLNVA